MAKYSLTPRGEKWEKQNSRWIAASFLGFGGPALMYVGSKVRVKKWRNFGILYTFLQLFLPLATLFSDSNKYPMSLAIAFVSYIISIVNSLVIKDEYILRLDAVADIGEKQLRERIAREYGRGQRLGGGNAGSIPMQGGYNRLHDQSYGIKRNAQPMMRGKPVHGSGDRTVPNEFSPAAGSDGWHSSPNDENTAANPKPQKKSANTPKPQQQSPFEKEPPIYEHTRLMTLDDFFKPRSERRGANVYFYRINGCNSETLRFISSYAAAAQERGLIAPTRLEPPDNEDLIRYEDMFGHSFEVSEKFVVSGIVKWLPEVEPVRRRRLANSILQTLKIMQKNGAGDSALRMSFIKFLCCFKDKFSGVVQLLGEEKLPKILCEGAPDTDDLMLLNIISDAGCDVVMLLYKPEDEEKYLEVDPNEEISDVLSVTGMKPFPEDFSVENMLAEKKRKLREHRAGKGFIYSGCTNVWTSGKAVADVRTPPEKRGGDPHKYYNVFARISGVWDKGSYLQELYDLYRELKKSGRGVAAVSGIEPPTVAEKQPLQGGVFETADELITEMAAKIQYGLDPGLQWKMAESFSAVMRAEADRGVPLRELSHTAICIVCYLKRYMADIFPDWKMPQVGAFLMMGGCKTDEQALFLKLLSTLPVDVLILTPGYDEQCCLKSPELAVEEYLDFLDVDKYPTDPASAKLGTDAYRAERELDTLLYEDSGMYRNRQFAKANSVTLSTMFEEIFIYWNEELRFRPNFSAKNGAVNMPVVFSKISGVKNSDPESYWEALHGLITPETILISQVPYVNPSITRNPYGSCTRFLQDGELQLELIKGDPNFRYRLLRTETIDFILDKLQMLLDSRVIKGCFSGSGVEFRVVATALSLDEYILRMIQNFDFTKQNPKLMYVQAGNSQPSFEDAVIAAFLNLIGFDILVCVPTGYRSLEQYYNSGIIEEHQIGEYMYDLPVPDLKRLVPRSGFEKWQDKFRRK